MFVYRKSAYTTTSIDLSWGQPTESNRRYYHFSTSFECRILLGRLHTTDFDEPKYRWDEIAIGRKKISIETKWWNFANHLRSEWKQWFCVSKIGIAHPKWSRRLRFIRPYCCVCFRPFLRQLYHQHLANTYEYPSNRKNFWNSMVWT